jgi:hypothetical protein
MHADRHQFRFVEVEDTIPPPPRGVERAPHLGRVNGVLFCWRRSPWPGRPGVPLFTQTLIEHRRFLFQNRPASTPASALADPTSNRILHLGQRRGEPRDSLGILALFLDQILTLGPDADPAALGSVPANAHVARCILQSLLLPRCEVVLTHGGAGTVQARFRAHCGSH